MTDTDAITAEEFQASPGVDDWRVRSGMAAAHFATGSFATGVELVRKIGELADAANHHPDVDLRYPSVAVRLVSHDIDSISRRDAALAQQISSAAADLGIVADPTQLD